MALSDMLKNKAEEILEETEEAIKRKVDEVIEQEKQSLDEKLGGFGSEAGAPASGGGEADTSADSTEEPSDDSK